MDRVLTVEFPWFLGAVDRTLGTWIPSITTDTRQLAVQIYCQEQKIDLSGYVQSDLTVGFRRSFEQQGASEFLNWYTYDPSIDYSIESIVISSVPLNDEQLQFTIVSSPGFTQFANPSVDMGNFNREHIIHGTYKLWYANSNVGSGAFATENGATLMALTDNVFSSLEPTAADCLYCYRVFLLPTPQAGGTAGPKNISLPPKRVILDAFTVQEPDLEYMMRLKRSYELANQV